MHDHLIKPLSAHHFISNPPSMDHGVRISPSAAFHGHCTSTASIKEAFSPAVRPRDSTWRLPWPWPLWGHLLGLLRRGKQATCWKDVGGFAIFQLQLDVVFIICRFARKTWFHGKLSVHSVPNSGWNGCPRGMTSWRMSWFCGCLSKQSHINWDHYSSRMTLSFFI